MENRNAICLIQDINTGLFLLLKRNENMRQFKGMFTLPGGKFDDSCDKYILDTLKREVKEETNIDLDNNLTFFLMESVKDNVSIMCFYSIVDMEDVHLKLNPEEHSEYVFVNRDDIMFYLKDVPVTIECVQKYIKEIFPSH